MSFHLAMSFSWMELNWSGFVETSGEGISLSQCHWTTAASRSGSGGIGVVLEQLGSLTTLRACPA